MNITSKDGSSLTKLLRSILVRDLSTLGMMTITVLVGGLLAYWAVGAFEAYCLEHDTWSICKLGGGYPWTTLAALAAAPSILLMWYWRTIHKWRDIANTNEANEAAREANETTKDSLAPDQFRTAVEMLDKSNASTLGGIHALHALGIASPRYRPLTIDVLTSYIKMIGPQIKVLDAPSRLTPTIHLREAVTTLRDLMKVDGCLGTPHERHPGKGSLARVDLSQANLSQMNLSKLDFRNATLAGTDMSESILIGTDFTGAQLPEAMFRKATLTEAVFHGANLRHAHMEDSDLTLAVLTKAELVGAALSGSTLIDANLEGAVLVMASLVGAVLRRANMTNALIALARRDESTFTQEQIDSTKDGGLT